MITGLLDLLRLFALQASWNRRSMQDLGWIAAVAPHLRHIDDEEWIPRWSGFRNTHPYLAGLVLGAGARMEIDGQGDRLPPLLDAWSRALGATGDAVFWIGLRPAVALATVAVGLGWNWQVVIWSWLSFALLVGCGLRLWGLRRGFALGEGMMSALPRERQQRWIRWARWAASLGAIATTVMISLATEWSAGAASALAGGALLLWRRLPPELAVVVAAMALTLLT